MIRLDNENVVGRDFALCKESSWIARIAFSACVTCLLVLTLVSFSSDGLPDFWRSFVGIGGGFAIVLYVATKTSPLGAWLKTLFLAYAIVLSIVLSSAYVADKAGSEGSISKQLTLLSLTAAVWGYLVWFLVRSVPTLLIIHDHSGSKITDSTLEKCRFVYCDLRGSDLSGSTFRDCDFSMCDMRGCLLTGTRFDNCTMAWCIR